MKPEASSTGPSLTPSVRWKIAAALIALAIIPLIFQIVTIELSTSRLQARYFSNIARTLTFHREDGPSPTIRFPSFGPYDIRLGYTRIPAIVKSLRSGYFRVEAQARISNEMRDLIDAGIYPVYHEKSQAGLTITGNDGMVLYSSLRPERVYRTFDEIPPLVLQSLLYIENREILDERYPFRNPAIEWDRFARAILEKTLQLVVRDHQAPGGSTIATQLEKYRHSPEGRTATANDKLQQMISASFRAYLAGDQTLETRRDIILRYINSIPLAALPGFGEVNGLGDGMWAWYGEDFNTINQILLDEGDQYSLEARARTFKQVLSLFIAHRRPSYFLLQGAQSLEELTKTHLNLLESAGVITPELCAAALTINLTRHKKAPPITPRSFVERKASNAIRTRLLQILEMDRLYDLDNVDLTVQSTIDRSSHDKISAILESVRDAKTAHSLGLTGPRTLGRGDPAKVIYSFTLYEHRGNANLLRVQTDNYDKPFDINEGARLDLGSTAKLRTLVSYLQVIEGLYHQIHHMPREAARALGSEKTDVLTRWVAQFLIDNPKSSLADVLDAAMQRTYSASPGETFFTGGGLHNFVNFKREDNSRTVTVREAVRNSINLPFISIMRDVVKHYIAQVSGALKSESNEEQVRIRYLTQFADREGSEFLKRFYQKHKNYKSSDLLMRFVRELRPTPKRLAILFRYLQPSATQVELQAFIERYLSRAQLGSSLLESLYTTYAPGSFNLNDQGFMLKVHPLELWAVGYLLTHPGATFEETQRASSAERQEVYAWLLKPHNRRAQDIRIRTLIEADAFRKILDGWQAVGYPFKNMVPSYASAIGSSGDRPAALATLVGIILNDGIRYPEIRLEKLHFAQDTPFETLVSRDEQVQGERVLSSELAHVVKRALIDVVEQGTARRLKGAIKDAHGNTLVVGGKTGTGDNRYEVFGAGGTLISSRVISRTATFVFFIGDRYFGTVTAHVKGPEAAQYDFTSALAADLLKALAPALRL